MTYMELKSAIKSNDGRRHPQKRPGRYPLKSTAPHRPTRRPKRPSPAAAGRAERPHQPAPSRASISPSTPASTLGPSVSDGGGGGDADAFATPPPPSKTTGLGGRG